MLKIFNTLTKKKEKFNPVITGKVGIYVCGVTVYDLCHLGHGRTFVIFDVIVRYLRYCGYYVNYVRNITDIDDKIIKRAHKNNETITQLTDRMIQEMYLDLDTLNILRPNYEPRVTEYLDIIIKLIHLLIQKKHAYITFNGDVKFSITTAYSYGILSNQKKSIALKNIHFNSSMVNIHKKSMDFVLWKKSKPEEPYWMSPWGPGRPGWHIECSAMSHAILGDRLDIHGGGLDLKFPHHENEMAQSMCAYPFFYVSKWMHVGIMLSLNYEKMSKSENNFFTIRDALSKYNFETVRYFLMSSHYRNQLQYNDASLVNAQISLERLYLALRGTDPTIRPSGGDHFISKFISKMNDDFNIPEACSILFEIAHALNNLKHKKHKLTQGIASTLRYLANVLGLLSQDPEEFLKYKAFKKDDNYHIQIIQQLIEKRKKARQNNQWELADKIRKELALMGVILEDDLTGSTKWRCNNIFEIMKKK